MALCPDEVAPWQVGLSLFEYPLILIGFFYLSNFQMFLKVYLS